LREALTEITVDSRAISSVTISSGYLGMCARTILRSTPQFVPPRALTWRFCR
jgi:hypothetical protein